MHKAMKLLLKLFSSSRFDMKKNYQVVRDFQDFLAPAADLRDPIQDYGLPSLDPDRTIPIRIFYPPAGRKPGAIIYFHGGGWVIGNIDTYTPICSRLAEETRQLVFSVDYRLAPEYPFPAGLEDCLTAAHLLIDFYYARENPDQGLVTLCGDSAGANLAAVVSLFLRESQSRPADRQILFYPATYGDHNPQTSPFDSIRSMGEDYGLTSKKVQDYMSLYIPDPLRRKRPEVSPILAHNLRGLPPSLVLTAEYDPLRDEGEAFALALEQAGNQVELYRLLGAPHGYLAYPDWLGAIDESYRRILAFLESTEAGKDVTEEQIRSLEKVVKTTKLPSQTEGRLAAETRAALSAVWEEESQAREDLSAGMPPSGENHREIVESHRLWPADQLEQLPQKERAEGGQASRELTPAEILERQTWLHEISREKSQAAHPHLDEKLQALVSDQSGQQRVELGTAVVQASHKRDWLALDNASKIFPAAMTSTDTKVFRFTAVMRDEVDPLILQEALDQAYDNFPLYHAVLRRGFFWYYFQESDLRPRVRPETEAPVQGLYQIDRKNLLFRVLYYRQRIHLEVFHALSDGNGAADFFRLLLAHYVNLRYLNSEEDPQEFLANLQSNDLSSALQKEDSFSTYFAKPQGQEARKAWRARKAEVKAKAARLKIKWPHIYHITGTPTPDDRTQILECNMPLPQVLQLARDHGVSLSIYLTALFIQSIYRAKQEKDAKHPAERRVDKTSITLSVPVNLRSFYNSQSARNFFATVTIGYTYEGNEPTLAELCQEVKRQYQTQISKDNLASKLYRLYEFEENLALRPILRPLKDLVLKLSARFEDQQITTALSNMGKLTLPEEVARYLEKVSLCISARRPQFTCISFADNFSLSFCSPYQETDIQRHFLRSLSAQGVEITLAANNIGEERS